MKVLLVSEGKDELGESAEAGALTRLTRKLMNQDAEFTIRNVRDNVVHMHNRPGKAANYQKRAEGWIRYARNQDFDALVMVIDQDKFPDRKTGIDLAQENQHLDQPRALGIAIRSFDAWMLADETAWSKLSTSNANRSMSPESLANPKEVCEKLRDELQINSGLADVYAAIAEHADLNNIAKRCPRGFAPFKARVESLSPKSKSDPN